MAVFLVAVLVGFVGMTVAMLGGVAQSNEVIRDNMPAAFRGHEFQIVVLGFVLMSLAVLLAIVAK